MDIETDDTLLQISKGIRGANGGIALIAGVQRQHGESPGCAAGGYGAGGDA